MRAERGKGRGGKWGRDNGARKLSYYNVQLLRRLLFES